MVFECVAIIIVILVSSVSIISSNKRGSGFGIGILPLIFVPAAHILVVLSRRAIVRVFDVSILSAIIVVDILALVITSLLLGAISTRILKKRTRWTYLILCGGFSAILTCVLMVKSTILYY